MKRAPSNPSSKIHLPKFTWAKKFTLHFCRAISLIVCLQVTGLLGIVLIICGWEGCRPMSMTKQVEKLLSSMLVAVPQFIIQSDQVSCASSNQIVFFICK